MHTSDSNRSRRLGFVLGLAWLWAIAVTYWGLRTGADNLDARLPDSVALRPIGVFDVGLLVAVPMWLLARFVPDPRHKAFAQTLAWAGGFMVAMCWTQVTPLEQDQLNAALNLVGLLIYIGLLLAWQRFSKPQGGPAPGPATSTHGRPVAAALCLAPLAALPWLAWGALGSPIDTLLNLLTGLLFGAAAVLMLEWSLLRPLGPGPLAVFGASAALAVMAAGLRFDYYVLNLLLALTLAPLGWAVVQLRGSGSSSWPAATLLVGLIASAPMMLLDPEELYRRGHFYYAPGVPDPATAAAWASAGIGLGIGLLLLALRRASPAFWKGAAVLTWALGALVYAVYGRPGFYGEHYFVLFKEQADLSAAVTTADAARRRALVYERLVSHALESQSRLRAVLEGWHIPYTPYYLVNGLAVEGDSWLSAYLSTQSEVERIIVLPVDRPLPYTPPPRLETGDDGAPQTTPPNLSLIGADRVWAELGVTGEGVVVAGMDRGIQWDHPELAAGYRGANGQFDYHWYDPQEGTREPFVSGAHGTHTMGAAVGRHTGVAPGASWYYCALGSTLALRLSCLQFTLAPFPQSGDPFRDGVPSLGANVSTNSWECAVCDATLLQPAVKALRAAGVFVVAAAGNYGPGCASVSNPIANQDEVLTVGAVWSDGRLIGWSSRGPVLSDGSRRIKPDLLAPGVEILSAAPGGTYDAFSGTSFSAPHVAGVVALVWSANPALLGDVDRTEALLLETARPLALDSAGCGEPGQRPDNVTGYGLVDAYAAVKRAMAAP